MFPSFQRVLSLWKLHHFKLLYAYISTYIDAYICIHIYMNTVWSKLLRTITFFLCSVFKVKLRDIENSKLNEYLFLKKLKKIFQLARL